MEGKKVHKRKRKKKKKITKYIFSTNKFFSFSLVYFLDKKH